MASLPTVVCFLFMCLVTHADARYQPNWESLDSRPLPSWFDEAKIGIFMHWGVFSVPAFRGAWFWHSWKTGDPATVAYMKKNYKPDFTYADFAKDFTAKFYDPEDWANILKASGAKYVVLVTKHHEGFTNWPSNYSWNWNAKDVGPNRDLVGELATAIRKDTDIRFGVYHSLFEWYNRLYERDMANKYKTQDFVKFKTMPELHELVNNYHPDIVWSDGDWMVDDFYWNATDFLAWLYNDSPVRDTVVVNDRWGKNIRCKHGGFYNCDDRFNPGVLQKHKWENAMTMDKIAWTYRRQLNIRDVLTMEELLRTLAQTVSCGGNLLINVGPTADGTLIPIFQERLLQLGEWLAVNGEAIYSSKPWKFQNDTVAKNVWYTSKTSKNGVSVYAILPQLLTGEVLVLGAPQTSASTIVSMLGYNVNFDWFSAPSGGISVHIPLIPLQKIPCKWAWVLKFENLAN